MPPEVDSPTTTGCELLGLHLLFWLLLFAQGVFTFENYVRMAVELPAERRFWFDPPFHPGGSALLKRPIPLTRTFTANLMSYALGRGVEWYDMPTVRK